MKLWGNAEDVRPLQAGRGSGFGGLTPKQKKMLWTAAAAIAVIGGSVWAYLYIASAPQRAQKQFDESMKLMRPGSYQLAIDGFSRALNIWPNHAESYLERANAYRVLNRDDDALADFEKAVDLNPNLYRAYAAMGAIYRGRSDLKRAMDAYNKSIQSKPNIDAFFERGQTYESLGDHRKAIEDFDRAIAEMPGAPEVYRARSLARRNMGDENGYQSDRDAARQIETRR